MRRPHRATLTCLVGMAGALSLSTVTLRADAQSDEVQRRTTAEAIFAQGKKLMDKHQYDAACPKFEEVTRLMPGKIGALLQLAVCYEEAGKVASASTSYELARRAAKQESDGREKAAADKVTELARKIPRLTIVVPAAAGEVGGLAIERDSVPVGSPQWGLALPVDPGKHVVNVSAPGKKTWSRSVDVALGAAIQIEIPLLDDAATAAAPIAPAVVPAAAPAAPAAAATEADEASSTGSGVPTWAWVAGGAGLALLGGAAYFGVDGLDASSTLKEQCGDGLDACPPKAQYDPTDDNGRKNRDLILFSALGGAGAIAVGVAIYGIVSGPSSDDAVGTGLRVSAGLTPGSGGVFVSGGF